MLKTLGLSEITLKDMKMLPKLLNVLSRLVGVKQGRISISCLKVCYHVMILAVHCKKYIKNIKQNVLKLFIKNALFMLIKYYLSKLMAVLRRDLCLLSDLITILSKLSKM